MATQVATRSVKLSVVMGSAAFLRGYNEVLRGKPFDPEAFRDERTTSRKCAIDCQWNYERGRQFAYVYRGPLKSGRTVTLMAQMAYMAARKNGSLA